MADGEGGVAHLHPDDLCKVTSDVLAGVRDELRALFEATARGPASPPPGRPPVILDDQDARVFGRLKQDVLREASDTVRQATSAFLPEGEIEERISAMSATIDKRLDAFKGAFLDDVKNIVKDECGLLRSDIFDIFDDLGMPLEKGEEKRAKTRRKLDALFTMQAAGQELKSEFWKTMRGASIGGLVTAIMGFFAYLLTMGRSPH